MSYFDCFSRLNNCKDVPLDKPYCEKGLMQRPKYCNASNIDLQEKLANIILVLQYALKYNKSFILILFVNGGFSMHLQSSTFQRVSFKIVIMTSYQIIFIDQFCLKLVFSCTVNLPILIYFTLGFCENAGTRIQTAGQRSKR